jgi:diguanylate cyclase (GGDEF)-like protein
MRQVHVQQSHLSGWGARVVLQPALAVRAAAQDETAISSLELHKILKHRQLTAVFQPIADLRSASIFGHEGLIRGPVDTRLHMPLALFEEAEQHHLLLEVEHLSRQVVLESFAQQKTNAKLFLNVSPASLLQPHVARGATLSYIHQLGLDPHNVIIELTENSPTFDYDTLRHAAEHYRSMGFEIAMDDLGEGFSSLRLWSELRPDYVKIDKHFIRHIDRDQVKLDFVRSIQQIALNSGTKVIAEGIETEAELMIVKDLKIPYGQGYLINRPQAALHTGLSSVAAELMQRNAIHVYQSATMPVQARSNISKLIRYVSPVSPQTSNDDVYQIFEKQPALYSLPVVAQGRPVGLISRYNMIDHLARPYTRELYGKRYCSIFMDNQPLVVDNSLSLQALSDLIINMEPHHLSNGFIITESGNYVGMGSGHDLLREITQMQINAARYANPLTMLPGNVPINEHMDRLLQAGVTFHACYCDLDSFKPFNDVYGFRRGDELIQYTGKLLNDHIANELDFVGHIGGDDFILIFQSEDWEERCLNVLQILAQAIPAFYDEADRQRGGIAAEDRQGHPLFYPFVSMSVGSVKADPVGFRSHHEVAAAMTVAKKQAKKITGNSLFLERRGQ